MTTMPRPRQAQREQRARALIADSRKAAKRANFRSLATQADADLAEALLDGTVPDD